MQMPISGTLGAVLRPEREIDFSKSYTFFGDFCRVLTVPDSAGAALEQLWEALGQLRERLSTLRAESEHFPEKVPTLRGGSEHWQKKTSTLRGEVNIC